jgi:hypothetical protein
MLGGICNKEKTAVSHQQLDFPETQIINAMNQETDPIFMHAARRALSGG